MSVLMRRHLCIMIHSPEASIASDSRSLLSFLIVIHKESTLAFFVTFVFLVDHFGSKEMERRALFCAERGFERSGQRSPVDGGVPAVGIVAEISAATRQFAGGIVEDAGGCARNAVQFTFAPRAPADDAGALGHMLAPFNHH